MSACILHQFLIKDVKVSNVTITNNAIPISATRVLALVYKVANPAHYSSTDATASCATLTSTVPRATVWEGLAVRAKTVRRQAQPIPTNAPTLTVWVTQSAKRPSVASSPALVGYAVHSRRALHPALQLAISAIKWDVRKIWNVSLLYAIKISAEERTRTSVRILLINHLEIIIQL